ncbi:ADP-ribosylglycohydrolase family protein [Streptomyces werraensis]|uniref:ADP-ribosylglycohydrolase family protein n=1 Tax=Streptomyces werraensis TaxID=68284 RepID=UPI001CE35D6E
MHDVLDPRDLVPDEAEQLALSGYPVGDLRAAAVEAAAASDLVKLAEVRTRLTELERDPDWDFEEPEDDGVLLERAATVQPVKVNHTLVPERIRGAWLGRTVGNTLGKPVEGLTRTEIALYLRAAGQCPQDGYLPLLSPLPEGVSALHPSASVATAGRFVDVPRDDDIDWTILALHVMETHGADFTTEQIAAAWLDRVPFTQTYTAERAAYRNLIGGLRPPATATTDNPYREWIGALIRGDAFGYVSPGDPAGAARIALVDARLSHTANGKYGEMWAAALVAAALATDSAEQALHLALSVIPPRSRLHSALAQVLSLHDQGAGPVDALDWVDDALGSYPWVHTINNAALISIGLLWGGHFMDAVGITISGGRDTDSNAATVGSVYGALHGPDAIPPELVGTTHVHVRSAVRDYDRITITELAARTARLAHTLQAGDKGADT